MSQSTAPDHRTALLDAMRRTIAGSFAACWNGDACPHPTRDSCACLDAACLAFSGLTAYLVNAPLPAAEPEQDTALRLAVLARRLAHATTAQPAAHGYLPPAP